jgi:ferredoxin-thioredoxin reductase catalytic chain
MGDNERSQKELEQKILSWAKKYAEQKKWNLNTDDTQLAAVIRGLARNQTRHGERYCPCRVRSGDPEIDREIICPCIYHEEEIGSDGHCHCNLFFRD